MTRERFYDESEVEEILALAGARRAATDSYDTDDLIRAAAELNISSAVVDQAVQQVYVLREEAADRKEFQRRQLWWFLPLIVIVLFEVVFAPKQGYTFIAVGLVQVLAAALALYVNWRGKTSQFDLGFFRWRLKRIARAAPDKARPMIDRQLTDYVRDYPSLATEENLVRSLIKEYGLSRNRASDELRRFSMAHPEFANQIQWSNTTR